MKISYNWIRQFIKIDNTSEETASLLTDLGLEVESVDRFQSVKGGLEGIVVGHVLTCEKHPNADRLKVTTVDLGDGAPVQIVCGAANVAAGQKVPVATIGTTLFDKEGKAFQIKKGKIRDMESHGMICAEDEIGLGDSHDGILVLDAKLKPGTPVAEVFQVENDEVFEIGLTPNRADAMSHMGVARDLRAGLLLRNIATEFKTPSVSAFRVDKRTLKIDVKVEDAKLAPRYCGVTLSGVTVKPSPAWLQNRLKAIGINPKNNIVDVTNYVLHELGQPLHAFDAARITGSKVVVKTLPAGTKFTTLDEVERELHADDLMICDEKGPMCFAGVLGGKNSGVTENTNSIFLESAYFNPVSVRKTAKRHAINTDASFRFERGIDPTITEYALKRAALLIKELAGGEVTSDIIDLYPKKIEDFPVVLNFAKAARIIGQELPKETIKKILVSLDIKVNSVSDAGLGLTIPAYRVDVQREIDVIEEILRVYGYNNIAFSKKLNATVANSPRTEDYKIQNIVAGVLNANGFHEMMANSLTTPEYTALSETLKPQFGVSMLNPLSGDLAAMRQSMLFSGLEAVAYNINRRNSDLKLFEFGKTYHKLPSGYEEPKHLTLFMSGDRQAENWTPSVPGGFFLFKGYVEAVIARLGLTGTRALPVESDVFAEGMALALGNEIIVEFGTVRKNLLKAFDIRQEVLYADFNWNAVLKNLGGKIRFTDIPKYPEVRRDFALLLDENVSFGTIYSLARQTEKSLLKEVRLFDVYEGKNLPAGKKSYAVSFILQDTTKTLTDTQIDKIMSKLQQQFESELGASLR
ncbi:phenylalanine--tRNA ligase subunit beta [Flavobacterium sp. HJ-32-4]|uniref:phenylalanine--tRNA ligase subunit beta n=1 Tax=Flavobacterium sp. HJ-32-4 TaxID=1160795 RepID=UPI001F14562B|nr:phenylalanine--tRNA ligase subunit beta [Flavobacterium sp. HJ-32-4]UMY64706.1 phenylalanine--tRNA ligase subunit beta [Flavobacterium sp. HJ-32-4]